MPCASSSANQPCNGTQAACSRCAPITSCTQCSALHGRATHSAPFFLTLPTCTRCHAPPLLAGLLVPQPLPAAPGACALERRAHHVSGRLTGIAAVFQGLGVLRGPAAAPGAPQWQACCPINLTPRPHGLPPASQVQQHHGLGGRCSDVHSGHRGGWGQAGLHCSGNP